MGRPNQHPLNRLFNVFLISIIFINICAVILETVPSLSLAYADKFHLIEVFSVLIFTIEYFLRIWTSASDENYGPGIKGKTKYIFSTFAIIDLLAIAPSLFSILWVVDLRMLRILRLFRLVRLFKLARYSLAIYTLLNVFRRKRPELLVTFFSGLVLIVISSSLMYIVEHEAQPEQFSSIPATMWWAVATLTTIGYGDIYPITALGKLLGSIIAILGIGLFALPAAILATGFAETYKKDEHEKRFLHFESNCPTCGQKVKKKKKALPRSA